MVGSQVIPGVCRLIHVAREARLELSLLLVRLFGGEDLVEWHGRQQLLRRVLLLLVILCRARGGAVEWAVLVLESGGASPTEAVMCTGRGRRRASVTQLCECNLPAHSCVCVGRVLSERRGRGADS